jgi:hypothetical protein
MFKDALTWVMGAGIALTLAGTVWYGAERLKGRPPKPPPPPPPPPPAREAAKQQPSAVQAEGQRAVAFAAASQQAGERTSLLGTGRKSS